jgi:hypothetical protein
MIRQKHVIWSVVLCVLVLSTKAYSYIWSNGAGGGYEDPPAEGQSVVRNSIESYIIMGAGFYFDAVSGIHKVLKMVELQDTNGINENDFNQILENTLLNMQNAITTYNELVIRAELTPYKESVLETLKEFPYDEFMVQNGLNRDVFNDVEDYLYKGDITGVFKRTHARLVRIDAMLNMVKNEFALNKDVSIPNLWQLNETTAQLSLFGSYTARVFANLEFQK